ncbi:MAG: hypothetical protein HY913_00830 [Desulfomonile tiedjei]|nr:hypothetical protein [Desulfomonile tiedjei]
MNILKRGFIILVSVVFLGVVSIGGAQATTTVKGSKSNADNMVGSSPSDTDDSSRSSVKSSKSNASERAQDPKTKPINLNPPGSNIH